jgi:orotate phosphoribosyltransferase
MELIREYGIVFKDVELFSKISSPYYYDIKKVGFQQEGMHLLGDLLLTEIIKYGAKSVGGMEMGAVALVSAMVLKSTMNGKYDTGLSGFFIRREPKAHGLQKRIEGHMIAPVVIIDDVITSGQSVMDSIEAVNKEQVTPRGVICVIDREEEGTPNLLKQSNIKYSSLFKHSDFKEFIEEKLREKEKQ